MNQNQSSPSLTASSNELHSEVYSGGLTEDDRRANDPDGLVTEMQKEPYRFDFFQAVRRIEELCAESPRVGRSDQVASEPVRISQSAALDFAPATLEEATPTDDGKVRVQQRFFGLWGPSGPLPLHMTEAARHQQRHDDDPTQVAFADLFHHRMAVLFYRVWSESRGAVQRDRPDQDRYADFVSSVAGTVYEDDVHGSNRMQQQLADVIARDVQRFFAGRYGVRRTAEGLQSIIRDSFRIHASVLSFVPKRMHLREQDFSRLGGTIGESTAALGQSAVLGRRVSDRSSAIELQLGPLKLDEFLGFQPGALAFRILKKLATQYVGMGVDIQLRLILSKTEWPKFKLGQFGSLGRGAWMRSRPPKHDSGQFTYCL